MDGRARRYPRIGAAFADQQRARARAEVIALQIRVTEDVDGRQQGGPHSGASSGARLLLDRAQEFLGRGDVDGAWHFIFLARERLIETQSLDDLQADALALRAEVEASKKFSSWRADAIKELLDEATDGLGHGHPDASRSRRMLAVAARIRNEQYENEYRNLAIVRRHQRWLFVVGSVPLVALVVLLSRYSGPDSASYQPWLLWSALCAGALGAVVSAVQRSLHPRVERYPRQVSALLASFSRVPIGIVAGMTAWLAAHLATDDGILASAVLLSAFAAGFTERLVAPGSAQSSG